MKNVQKNEVTKSNQSNFLKAAAEASWKYTSRGPPHHFGHIGCEKVTRSTRTEANPGGCRCCRPRIPRRQQSVPPLVLTSPFCPVPPSCSVTQPPGDRKQARKASFFLIDVAVGVSVLAAPGVVVLGLRFVANVVRLVIPPIDLHRDLLGSAHFPPELCDAIVDFLLHLRRRSLPLLPPAPCPSSQRTCSCSSYGR